MSIESIESIYPELRMIVETPQSFGERFLASKYARPYRYKNRKALTNNRSGNKKKLHQFA